MKVIFYSTISIIFFLFSFGSTAQVSCGADVVRAKLVASDPAYKRQVKDMDESLRRYISAHPSSATVSTGRVTTTLYYIPCVVHVIYDVDPVTGTTAIGTRYNPTDAQINAAIDYINKVYDGTWVDGQGTILGAGDLQIKFILATKDPGNVTTTGIERFSGSAVPNYTTYGMKLNGANGASETTVKNISRWDPEKYYNIWTVNKIDGCDGVTGCASFVAGYAYFPMSPYTSTANMNLDGTLMLASQFASGQKTLPHELGHMLNLYHPFEGDGEPGTNACPTNTDPATDGDQIPDTDPITNPILAPNAVPFACRTLSNPCTGTAYTDNTEKNFMNYTNCYRLFTANQKTRMQASTVSSQRASLTSSRANNQNALPVAFAAPTAPVIPTISTLFSADVAGIMSVSLNGIVVYSLDASQDGGYLNNSTKWYDAFQLSPNTLYSMTVVLNGFVNEQLGVWIDYNNDHSFNNTTEQLYLNTNIAAATASAGVTINFTTPSTWTGANNYVAMRLMEDAGTAFAPAINNTTAVLKYGQAEDYAAFLTGGVVPVSLISFTGKQNPDAISLHWNTAQEINTDSYDIERSIRSGAFAAIGNLHAAGTGNGAAYNFRDADILTPGDYLYRLKVKDHDGSFKYSNILKFSVAERKKLIVAGNPFTDKINMLLPYANGTGIFRLTDAAGRLVYSNTIAINGTTSATLQLQNNLASGVYILEALINGEKFTERLYKN